MITVANGGNFVLSNTQYVEPESLITELKRILQLSRPVLLSLEVMNKTKHCTVNVVVNEGKVLIVVENPDDEIFKLEEKIGPICVFLACTDNPEICQRCGSHKGNHAETHSI